MVCMIPVPTLSQSKFLREIPQRRCVFRSNSCVRLLLAETKLWCFWKKRVGHPMPFFGTSEILSFLKNNDNNQPTKKPKQASEQPDKTKQKHTKQKKQTNKRQRPRQQTKTTTITTTTTTNQQTNQPVNH